MGNKISFGLKFRSFIKYIQIYIHIHIQIRIHTIVFHIHIHTYINIIELVEFKCIFYILIILPPLYLFIIFPF